jgi:sulfatase maturation enzyme AslB (radical SAM superfamily)
MSGNSEPTVKACEANQTNCPLHCRKGWASIYDTIPAHRTVHSIDLDVTESCNLACIYCFKWQKKAVNMDESTAKHAIDWLLESSGNQKNLKVNLMGG